MITRMGILEKSNSMTEEEFNDYWLNIHGPLVRDFDCLRKYHQNHIVDREQRGISYPRSSQVVDGFSELWFDDVKAMENCFNADALHVLKEDESKFLQNVPIIVARQNIVVPPPEDDEKYVKRMTLLKRRFDIDVEEFQHQWENVHGELVKTMPGIKGYIQNVIIDRELRGKKANYEDIPIDGIVEFWFDSKGCIEKAFHSPEGRKTMEHSESFLEEITTFLVKTHKIK
ncbi:EthD family reductase [Sporosarcina ureilytica]|uniref:EthD domain-containing protein n=1 Tax=Sporosarcina ureilytica TaxID=298596 RepID=A0A1D8JFK2_9BACL|nr:EthD family reductase [Sporosarcina ureilytica]AOV07485.1 hypothetical protein BI350_08010 [Sporosarcina ureilytica]